MYKGTKLFFEDEKFLNKDYKEDASIIISRFIRL